MMQVNFNFSPSSMTMIRQPAGMSTIILFSRIKISVNKRPSVVVSPLIYDGRIFAAPAFHSRFLFAIRRASPSIARNDRWFKMIGKRKDEVNLSFWSRTSQPLPGKSRKNTKCISQLLR